MCLIAFKRNETETYTKDYFDIAARNNSHGTGIMYPKDGRIVAKKVGVVDQQINDTLYEEFIAQPMAAIHVRIKTHGATNDFNSHPFCVLDKDEDGVDLYMMHNGIISNVDIVDDSKSDTWHFVNLYLKPLLKNDPYLLTNPYFQHMIQKFIGSSRLVFMYGDATYVIIHDGTGHDASAEIGGCWLSNRSSSHKPYVAPERKWYGNTRDYDDYDYNYGYNGYVKPALAIENKETVAPEVKKEEEKAFQFSKAKQEETKEEIKLNISDSANYDYEKDTEMDEDANSYDDEDGNSWTYSKTLGGYYPANNGDKHITFFDQRTLFAQALTTDEILDCLVKQTQLQIVEMLDDAEIVEELVFTLRDLHEEQILKNSA